MTVQFDLVDMRLFINVAEAHSLTRGAERSHLSAPAASVRIKHLEEAVGIQLLYRLPQGVTLTRAGQAYLHHARQVLHQLEHLRGDLQEYADGIKGHLRIHATTSATAELLPAVLGRYLAAQPDVNIDLREHTSAAVVRAVLDGQADMGIAAAHAGTEALDLIPYRQDRLVLATCHGHSLAQRATVSFLETLDYYHVGLQETTALHLFVCNHAQALHRPIRFRIQVGNFEAVCRMIEAGVGVGIVPGSIARRHAQRMAIRVVPLADDWAVRRLNVYVRDREQLPAFARDLLGLLQAEADPALRPASAARPVPA